MTATLSRRETLEALLERVRNASGPDGDLNAALHNALIGWHKWATEIPWIASDNGLPAYTASIDAALALVERALPGAEYEITTLYGAARVTLPMNYSDMDQHYGWREDGNVPLAICQALLTALIAQETTPE